MLGRDLYVQTIDYSSSVDDQSDREIVLETPPPLPPNNKVLSSKRSRMQQASANSVPKSKLDFAAEFSHLDKRSSSSDHIYEKDEDNHDRTSSSFKALPQSAHCILAATSSKRSSCKSKDTDCTPPSRDSSESDAKFELSSSDDDDLDDLPSLASAADPKTNSSSSSSKQSKGSSSSAGSFVIDDSEDEEESELPKPKYTRSMLLCLIKDFISLATSSLPNESSTSPHNLICSSSVSLILFTIPMLYVLVFRWTLRIS